MGGVLMWFQRLLVAVAAAAGLTTGMGCLAMFPCPEQLLDTWPVVATDIVDLEGAEIQASINPSRWSTRAVTKPGRSGTPSPGTPAPRGTPPG